MIRFASPWEHPGPEPPARIAPHSRPCLGEEETAAACRVLRSGRLSPGVEAARLEGLVARMTDAADAVAVASGTLALTLALRVLGLGPRDEVAIPSFTCAAVLHAVRAAGASPVVCDVDPATLSLDPEDLDRRRTRRLRAVVLVHPFGVPARPDPFRSRGLLVVEDCAQALGAVDRGRPVGARGEVAVLSLAPTKVITCGGPGGALASPRAALVRAARELAIHDEREVDRPRLNGLMGDLHASIAAVQIGRLREFRDRRAAIASRYDEALSPLGLDRPRVPEGARPITYRYLLRLPQAGRLVEALNQRGIAARRPVYIPLHRLVSRGGACPEADAAHDGLVSLPISPALRDDEVERVIKEVLRCRP
ncbi:MAG: DegT/DnrJ/EryC1/StrS family aminotransferase [Acidobacteriota bacterium]